MPAITTSIGHIERSHFVPLSRQTEARSAPSVSHPQPNRRDLLGGLIHEYEYAA